MGNYPYFWRAAAPNLLEGKSALVSGWSSICSYYTPIIKARLFQLCSYCTFHFSWVWLQYFSVPSTWYSLYLNGLFTFLCGRLPFDVWSPDCKKLCLELQCLCHFHTASDAAAQKTFPVKSLHDLGGEKAQLIHHKKHWSICIPMEIRPCFTGSHFTVLPHYPKLQILLNELHEFAVTLHRILLEVLHSVCRDAHNSPG